MLRFLCLVVVAVVVIGWVGDIMNPPKTPEQIEKEALDAAAKAETEFLRDVDRALGFVESNLEHFQTLRPRKYDRDDRQFEINLQLASFDEAGRNVVTLQKTDLTPENQALAEAFKSAVSNAQERVFPSLRDQYGFVLRERLWEHDVSARTIGEGYRTVELTGGVFAANGNIKKFNESIFPTNRRMRFNESRFLWRKGATEATHYELPALDDGEVGYWDGRVFVYE